MTIANRQLLTQSDTLRTLIAALQNAQFAERKIWNIRAYDCPDHSGLMPAVLITLAHFSVSSAMSLPKSAGELESTVPPKAASRAFILGSAMTALISLFSLSMIAAGVFLGAPTPCQLLAS